MGVRISPNPIDKSFNIQNRGKQSFMTRMKKPLEENDNNDETERARGHRVCANYSPGEIQVGGDRGVRGPSRGVRP